MKYLDLTKLFLAASLTASIACASNFVETNNNSAVVQKKEQTVAHETKKPVSDNSPEEAAKKEARILVWDGRIGASFGNKSETQNFSAIEREFVANAVNENLDKIKKLIGTDEFECESPDASLEAAGKGSFTKPGSKQSIYLYRNCVSEATKYPGFVSGIIVTENNKIIAHYVYADILSSFEMKILPDIDKNGLSEFALEYSGTQASYTSNVTIHELAEKGVADLGSFNAFTNSPDKGEKDGSETAWKISVVVDKNPVFFRETFKRKSNNEKWDLTKTAKAEKFSLEKPKAKFNEYFKNIEN